MIQWQMWFRTSCWSRDKFPTILYRLPFSRRLLNDVLEILENCCCTAQFNGHLGFVLVSTRCRLTYGQFACLEEGRDLLLIPLLLRSFDKWSCIWSRITRSPNQMVFQFRKREILSEIRNVSLLIPHFQFSSRFNSNFQLSIFREFDTLWSIHF